MRVEIDLELCIFAGECVYNHPELFEWSDDDHPMALKPQVTEETDIAAVRQAISLCPSGAIALTSEAG